MFLSNPFADAFGLDIGDLSIKLLQLKRQPFTGKQSTLLVKELRTILLPPGYIVNGEIQQPEMVRKKILHILGKDEGKYKPILTPWVVTALPEPKSFLKLITIDAPEKDLTSDDILFQAKKHLPFDLEEAHIDWQIVTTDIPNPNISKILIGAVPKTIADSYIYLLASVGLQPITLEIEALAIARAMITANKDYTGEARAILDLGATRSSLVIYDHGSVQFSMNLNFSGELITTGLIQALKIDYATAETLKIKEGIVYNKAHPKYLKIMTGLADRLIDELKIALSFYQNHFPDPNPITHITLCGGVAGLKNLDTTISRKLKISAHPGNAWKNLFWKKAIGDEEKIKGLGLATVIGLAIHAAKEPW